MKKTKSCLTFCCIDVKYVIVMNILNDVVLNILKVKHIHVRNVIFQQKKQKIYQCQVKNLFFFKFFGINIFIYFKLVLMIMEEKLKMIRRKMMLLMMMLL
jgi:hypothetical protein